METGVLIRWGASRPGREQESLDLYREAVDHNRRLVREGKLTYFEPFMLASGDTEIEAGFFVLKGPVAEIFAVLDSEEYRDIMMRSSLLVEHLRVDMLTVGEAIDRGISDMRRALATVGS